jgi:Phosphofructokinase
LSLSEATDHQSSALALAQLGFPLAGVASPIDNDLPGTDLIIGVDTALNIALEAIDEGEKEILLGMQGAQITGTPLRDIVGKGKPLKSELFHLAPSLGEMIAID